MTEKNRIKVIHSDGSIELFKPSLIKEYLLNETDIDEKSADSISKSISRKFNKLKPAEVTTQQIRAEVTSHLTSREIKEEPSVIITESDILSLLQDYDNNNANQVRSAGALEYSLFEMVSKRYMMTQYNDEVREAINEGLIYVHDGAQELYKGINCFTIDPRFILEKGLYSYGDNNIGCISAPPKHFDTALNLLEQAVGLSSTYIAGGVSIGIFAEALAPYIVDMDDKSVRQALQSFVFTMNQAFKNRGSQSVFSSINLDLAMPKFLMDQQAILPGGIRDGSTYKDYQTHAIRIVKIISEIMTEGDASGKMLFFPNLCYNVDGANLDDFPEIFALSAKFSLPYFGMPSHAGVEYGSYLGCRTFMGSNWTGDPNKDCLGTGNAVYTTISLPAVALKAKHEGKDFFILLDEIMELVREYNKNRLEWIKKLWYESHLADFMIQTHNDIPFYNLENATLVEGTLGLSECLEILGYGTLDKAVDKGEVIISFMKDKIDQFKKEDNLRWSLFSPPNENASLKLAEKKVEEFGFSKSFAKGDKDAPFYTNSIHIPVDADVDLVQRIKTDSILQPYSLGGCIGAYYLGEKISEPSALKTLAHRIQQSTDILFYSFTTDFCVCPKCHSNFKGVIKECPFDGEETDIFSRVCGYITNTKSWNKGKQNEFEMRKRY